jgi:endothelin-converting enzyme/putative endopeptidase
MRHPLLLAASAAAFLVACSDESAVAPPSAEAPRAAIGTFGIDTAAMDTSVKPGDDFYRYVNGAWVSTFPMPADKARYGVFDALRDKSEVDVRTLLDELAANPPAPGSVQQKVADLYGSWMDEASIETRGIEPLEADLEAISAARTKNDIVALMGNIDYAGPIGVYISPDPADPTRYVVNITQAGLGMPVRDYYLNEGDKFDAYRAAYKAYATKIFELIGDGSPAQSADAVVALETELATVHWSPERQRDVQATNNPVDRAGLAAMIPAVDWDVFLPVAGLGSVQNFVVNETTALRDGAALLDTQPVDAWKKYLAFHLASDYASSLPKAFDDANFDFYRRTIALHLEARRAAARRPHRRGRRGALRREIFPARLQSKDGRARRQPRGGHERALEDALLDGRPHARGSAEEARHFRSACRVSREMARLLGLCRRTGQAVRERAQRPQVRMEPRGRSARRARRPRRVGHEPANRQRLLQSARQSDHLPRRDPPAALLRPVRRPRRELRRHRRRDRARDRPWL